MAKKQKEYAVECKMAGTVTVYVMASSDEEAIAEAESFHDSEITGWEISQVLRADANE